MKTLYLDLSMGAAGDMLAAALIGLLEDPEKFIEDLNRIFSPRLNCSLEDCEKQGVMGKRFRVHIDGCEEGEEHTHAHEDEHHHHEHAHEHEHSTPFSINGIVDHLLMPQDVIDEVKAVYGLLAEAESEAHGVPVTEVHFHEVGALDAVADITAVCYAMWCLAPEKVVASTVNAGSGHVHCAHGILPVPAPATLNLLRDSIPYYGSGIDGELLTPTGAALIKHFVGEFGNSPVIIPEKISYGMGKRDYERVNAVRAVLGNEADTTKSVTEIEFNVDDMTGEELGFLTEELFESGALDVFTVPIYMKKNRPGVLVKVICGVDREGELVCVIFRHSSTLGVRVARKRRHTLERTAYSMENSDGEWTSVKHASGFGVNKLKAEYEPAAYIARETGRSLREVTREIEDEWKRLHPWEE